MKVDVMARGKKIVYLDHYYSIEAEIIEDARKKAVDYFQRESGYEWDEYTTTVDWKTEVHEEEK